MGQRRSLDMSAVRSLCQLALAEDIGRGDATTAAIVPPDLTITGYLRAREESVVAGVAVVIELYHQLDRAVDLDFNVADGDRCCSGDTIGTIVGNARSIITGERCALNFLQHLSGIATSTRRYVDALGDSRTKILDTRKTIPGQRILQKYAVSVGGGQNHRIGLYDQIMIKDNHLHLISSQGLGGITQAVERCKEQYPDLATEVEVDTLEQLEEALSVQAELILLDNMTTDEMIQAVKLRDRLYSQALLEASGGITLERIAELKNIGLDYISVGALTHSVKAVDIGLDIKETQQYP